MRKYKRLEEKAKEASRRLEERYPDSECALKYDGDPWRLLVMARLSAQCTDERVNKVSIPLFEAFPTVYDMASADVSDIENLIKSCGLFRGKAKNIKEAAEIISEKYGGEVPQTMEELLTLPGVGRKIANLMMGDVFGGDGVVADTHCIRICGKLGFYPRDKKDPVHTEKVMSQYLPVGTQSDFCHRIVWFGREVCTARSPKCDECPLSDICDKYLKEHK